VASRWAPAAKLERIRALGAELELVDRDFETARERAASIAQRRGVRLVEDSLNIETCEGAADVGLELAGAASAFDAVLTALGGGAMATGVGYVVKALAPQVEVICVQPRGAPAMTRSWHERPTYPCVCPVRTAAATGRASRMTGDDHVRICGSRRA
jgi:threonine dehydratase